MVLKPWPLIAILVLAPGAQADDQMPSAEFLQYLAEFSDDQGNSLDPELIVIVEDQTNSARDPEVGGPAQNEQSPSVTSASAGNAFNQGEEL